MNNVRRTDIMNILVLNYEYPPLGGGAAPVSRDISEQLAAAGNKVTVVTMGFKNLPYHENKHLSDKLQARLDTGEASYAYDLERYDWSKVIIEYNEVFENAIYS